MDLKQLKKRIDIAAGRRKADLVIKNCRIVDVYTCTVREGDIAVSDGVIAGIGSYEGAREYDAQGQYALPGLIDSHIHIESAYVTPGEFGRLVVPHGTTTVIADPHEIVNVCGEKGLEYMVRAAEDTLLDIKYMLPSCVPATPFEHAGAVLDAEAVRKLIGQEKILGLGEFMNFPGVIGAADSDLEKILAAQEAGKPIDGHSPGVMGADLNAYVSAGIRSDHECSTLAEMQERLSMGVYVLMRQGSASKDMRKLLKGVTKENSRRCLLCSDDRQPKSIAEEGHVDSYLRLCREEQIDALTAVQMATLNAAECFHLHDRGAIAPGLRADIVLAEDLDTFRITHVWIEGNEAADSGLYLPEVSQSATELVRESFHVKDFSADKLHMHLKSDCVHVIELIPGSVASKKETARITLTKDGDFQYDASQDIVKVAVVERHHCTGNVGLGLLRGYGIKAGAVAISVAHDSHNIIAVGTSNDDMTFAVRELIAQGGGIILVKDQRVLERMELPIGGLMSDRSGEWVSQKLEALHEKAHTQLGISGEVEPLMTLCFMALPVIPELKVTDMGLFDVTQFAFIPVECAEDCSGG